MQDLFRKLNQTISTGQDAVLVTIVASSGSTPRGSGARMLVTGEGRITGTVGGGAVEYECEKLALRCLENKGSTREYFRLQRNDVADIGMVCGGNVDVYFRYIPAGDEYFLSLTQRVEELFTRGEQSWIITQVDENNDGNVSLYTKKDGVFGAEVPGEVIEKVGNRPARTETSSGDFYVEKLVDSARVFVFGGGHVSQALVPLLAQCDFRVVLVEERPEFAQPELFGNKCSEIRLIDMTKVNELVPEIREDDFICVMTRGHKGDYLVQYEMLKTPACYIGVIGSRHKVAAVNERLKADGYTDLDIGRITSPIGLEILAETPAEIAVSVAAQMIEIRARRNGSRRLENQEKKVF